MVKEPIAVQVATLVYHELVSPRSKLAICLQYHLLACINKTNRITLPLYAVLMLIAGKQDALYPDILHASAP